MVLKTRQFIINREWFKKRQYPECLQVFDRYFPNGGEVIEVLKQCVELDYIKHVPWMIPWMIPMMLACLPYPLRCDSNEALNLVNQLVDLNELRLAEDLCGILPFNETTLELDNVEGHLFYNGNVHIKGNVNTGHRIFIAGDLKVDGNLTVRIDGTLENSNKGEIHARHVKAHKVNLRNGANIQADIKAYIVNNMHSFISGDVNAEILNIKGHTVKTRPLGFIDYTSIKGGYVRGNVNANKILNDSGIIRRDVKTIKIENINNGKVGGKITYKNSDKHRASI